jgi:ParB-like chromosome segregation protein Spo0J
MLGIGKFGRRLDKMTKPKLEVHAAAAVFPMMPDDELAELAADIKANGLLSPIVTDADGKVLIDGRNRLKACEIAGVEPKFSRLNGVDPVAFILSSNIARRHMKKSQQAMAVAMIYPEPQKGGRGKIAETAKLPVHPMILSQCRKVLKFLPETAKNVLAGIETLDAAFKAAGEEEEAQGGAEARLEAVRAEYPEIAKQVENEVISLSMAEAAVKQDREEKAREEASRRSTYLRVSQEAYAGMRSLANEAFVDGLVLRLDDENFREEMTNSLRASLGDFNERAILSGAKALIEIIKLLQQED